MTSPGQREDSPVPNPTVLAGPNQAGLDEGQVAEQTIQDVLARLDEVGDLPVTEHVERFEAVHTVLTEALNKAEDLLSGTNSNGS